MLSCGGLIHRYELWFRRTHNLNRRFFRRRTTYPTPCQRGLVAILRWRRTCPTPCRRMSCRHPLWVYRAHNPQLRALQHATAAVFGDDFPLKVLGALTVRVVVDMTPEVLQASGVDEAVWTRRLSGRGQSSKCSMRC